MKHTILLLFLAHFFYNYSQQRVIGLAHQGGEFGSGVIYSTNADGDDYQMENSFYSDAGNPFEFNAVIESTDGSIYGLSKMGCKNCDMGQGQGVLFEYDLESNTNKVLFDFTAVSGHTPRGKLTQAGNGKLYGLTSLGGQFNFGTIFEYDAATNVFTKLHDFNGAEGKDARYSLIEVDNTLYGVTFFGGANDYGVVFSYNLSTQVYDVIHDFIDPLTEGKRPVGDLLYDGAGKLYGLVSQSFDGIYSIDLSDNTFQHEFDFSNFVDHGANPVSIVFGPNGKIYGSNYEGGVNNNGILFEFDVNTHQFTKKVDFQNAVTGRTPNCNLIVASDGKIYGFTQLGGEFDHSSGKIFSYDPGLNELELHHEFNQFNQVNGVMPLGQLLEYENGKFLGISQSDNVIVQGGGSLFFGGKSTLFEFVLNGNIVSKKLAFDSSPDGHRPSSGLLDAYNGLYYGTCMRGGSGHAGTLFSFDLNNNIKTKLFDFDGSITGNFPSGPMALSTNNKIYGTTRFGGVNNLGILFEFDPATNTFEKKVDFGNFCQENAYSGLVADADGNLYGVTFVMGSTPNSGILYKYDPLNEQFTVLHEFVRSDVIAGIIPRGDLLVLNNCIYGTTDLGGQNSGGVLYKYDLNQHVYTKLYDFSSAVSGSSPQGNLIPYENKLLGMCTFGGQNNLGTLYEFDTLNLDVTTLKSFDINSGGRPYGTLLKGDDVLYGTTSLEGDFDYGTFFKYDLINNTFEKKVDFRDSIGSMPSSNKLILSCVTPEPVGDSIQFFCLPALVSDFVVNGAELNWYDNEAFSAPINTGNAIDTSIYYFVSQTIGGCESNSKLKVRAVIDCLNVNEIEIEKPGVFPNPTTDKFWIEGIAEDQNVSMSLYDQLGKLMFTADKNYGSFPGNVENGTYHLIVKTSQGEFVFKLVLIR
jgi:uncharacterized repeat protein (TIGR03803 family)